MATRQFTIQSGEGLPIRGTLVIPPRARSIVVVVHGFKGFRQWGFFPWLSERFAKEGIASCRFDMSRNGIGEDGESFDRLDLFADDTYSIELADVASVVRHISTLRETRNLPVFLFGHSRGGGVALLSAAAVPALRGVITWSAIANVDRWDEETKKRWRREGTVSVLNARTGQEMRMSTRILDDYDANRARLDIAAAVTELNVPLLVLHGGSDETVPAEDARAIAASGRNVSLIVLAGATHTFGAIHPLVHVPRELQLAAGITSRFILTYS